MITRVKATIRVILVDIQFLEEVEGSDQASYHSRSAKIYKEQRCACPIFELAEWMLVPVFVYAVK